MTDNATTITPTETVVTTKKSAKTTTVTDAYIKLKALPKNVFDKFESTDEIQQIINVANEVISTKLAKEISDLTAKLEEKKALQKQTVKPVTNATV